jgi:nucleoside-diphosphate-sugar epimerase
MARLLIFGLGYSGVAVARAALAAGFDVAGTLRRQAGAALPGIRVVPFDTAEDEIARATHLLATAPPGEAGDPVLARYGSAVRGAPNLQWLGYMSTTGVYGDRKGATVDEDTPPAPSSERARRRLHAEDAWAAASAGKPLDVIRLAGIYGPGRSALDEVRSGRARRILAPGHAFGRIHVADIAAGVLAAMAHPPAGERVLNFADDTPSESADVIAEAAQLLGAPVPDCVTLTEAWPHMSEMARSFWSDNRRVDSRKTQAAIAYRWRYPSYREGLRAVLAEERGDQAA